MQSDFEEESKVSATIRDSFLSLEEYQENFTNNFRKEADFNMGLGARDSQSNSKDS